MYSDSLVTLPLPTLILIIQLVNLLLLSMSFSTHVVHFIVCITES